MSDIFDELIKSISDQFDAGVVSKLGSETMVADPLPTGVPIIDTLLHGGFPKGRISEVFGPEATGKTTLILHVIKTMMQSPDSIVVFVDAEQSLDIDYCRAIGVDISKIAICQPEYGEQAFEVITSICENKIKMGAKADKANVLIAIDSIPGLIPKAEIDEEDFAKVGMAQTARMFSRLLPRILTPIKKANAAVIFTNQIRENIGGYGSSFTTPGGRAMKFFASCRVRVSRKGAWTQGDKTFGIQSSVQVVKSKLYPAYQGTAEYYIGSSGINVLCTAIQQGIVSKLITKAGAWYGFKPDEGDEVKGQGFMGLAESFRKNIPAYENLTERLYGDQSS